MSDSSTASAATGVAEELCEPRSLLEAVRVLRSHDPHYEAILSPSPEQLESLNAVVKCLRLQLDNGVDEAKGDATAFELAVALLWHAESSLVAEGVDLMEYLLKERWSQRWSTVTHARGPPPQCDLIESIDDDDDGEGSDEAGAGKGWVDLGPPSCSRATAPAAAAAGAAVPVGMAVRFATAPPPPEVEAGSVPASLVRERSGAAWPPSELSREPTTLSAGVSPAATSTERTTAAHTSSSCSAASSKTVTGTVTSSYTSPGTDSCGCAAVSTATSATTRSTMTHDERLARCYYHLAVGCTKLRRNDQALFYTNSLLRLCPEDRDGLRLKRLLCARLYMRSMIARSVPFLAIGVLFL